MFFRLGMETKIPLEPSTTRRSVTVSTPSNTTDASALTLPSPTSWLIRTFVIFILLYLPSVAVWKYFSSFQRIPPDEELK